VARAEQAADDLQRQALDLAAAPVAEITNTFPQLIRYLARKSGKEVRFELVGDEHVADRQVLERLSDPIRQLLVNAIHHGVETVEERNAAGKPRTALVALRVQVKDNKLELVVEDDGRGIDWAGVHRAAVARGIIPENDPVDLDQLKSVLFAPGFSTCAPNEIVGDGNGLAAAAEAVEALHGTLTVETTPDAGTRLTMVVPTSRALQDAVLIVSAGQKWGIPEIAVLDRIPAGRVEFHGSGADLEMTWEGERIPVSAFAQAVGLTESEEAGRVLVVSTATGPVGFTVTEEIGARQVASRELGPLLDGVPHLTGAALLGGGDVVVLVDPARLAERARQSAEREGPMQRVLVIDDSLGARQVVGGALGSAGFEVSLAGTAAEALDLISSTDFDAIVSDYVLPSMDGAALVREMRRRGVTAPIVVLSGLATPHDQAQAMEAGADLYFDKDDVRRGALADALRDLIRGN
jgi:chemotaxis protein histidine kinase CheA